MILTMNETTSQPDSTQGVPLTVISVRYPGDMFNTITVTQSGRTVFITDEIMIKWQATSLAYLMASVPHESIAQQAVWEVFAQHLKAEELDFIENYAQENARTIYADVMNGRNNHIDKADKFGLNRVGLVLLEKWIARAEGFHLTDADAEKMIQEIMNETDQTGDAQ